MKVNSGVTRHLSAETPRQPGNALHAAVVGSRRATHTAHRREHAKAADPHSSARRTGRARPLRRMRSLAWATGLVGMTMLGCASLPGPSWRVQPTYVVEGGVHAAPGYLALARQHEGEGRHAQALDAYRRAAEALPTDADLQNSLGLAYAKSGQFALAVAALRRAVALAPERAQLLNNLGYALMLAGRPEEARRMFSLTLAVDPLHELARANLGHLAQQAAAQGSTTSNTASVQRNATGKVARQAAAGADSPPATGVSNAVVAQSGAAAPSTEQDSVSGAGRQLPALPSIDLTEDRAIASLPPVRSTFPPSSKTQKPASIPSEQSPAAEAALRLEVSNGNGVNGLAARIARWLASSGMEGARLTNQRPYQQQLTSIQYRSGHEASAQRVARALRATDQAVSAVPTPSLRSDVRVVLGRDWSQHMACAGDNACAPVLAQLGPQRN